MATINCPVCGMEVKGKKFSSDYKGKKYYFCSLLDKQKFDVNPEMFTNVSEYR